MARRRHCTWMIGMVLLAGCSGFQGNDGAYPPADTSGQISPEGKVIPLPPLAPAAQRRANPGAITRAQPLPNPPAAPSPPVTAPSVPLVTPAAPTLVANDPISVPPPSIPEVRPASVVAQRAPGSLVGSALQGQVATSPPFTPQTPRAFGGQWVVSEPQRSQTCRLSLLSTGQGAILNAESQGCASLELRETVAWQSRGDDIVLLDAKASPIVLFRPVSANHYEGRGLAGEAFVLSR